MRSGKFDNNYGVLLDIHIYIQCLVCKMSFVLIQKFFLKSDANTESHLANHLFQVVLIL